MQPRKPGLSNHRRFVWARANHTFKSGVDNRRPLVRSFNDQFARGRLSFNNLADLLAGVAAPSGTSIARGATRRDTYTKSAFESIVILPAYAP